MEVLHQALSEGMTQREIAEVTEVHESLVSRWINGCRAMTLERRLKLTEALRHRLEEEDCDQSG